MAKTIAILIGFLPNPRFIKRIELEKEIGQVHLICWDRGESMQFPPEAKGYTLHVIHIKAGIDPIKRMLPFHSFDIQASALLKEIQPDLIHVQGLDMLKIASAYKRRVTQKVSIIYEVADLHRLLVDKQRKLVPFLAQKYLRFLDIYLEKQYDYLILTSMKYYEAYFQNFVDKDKVIYMPNVPDLASFQAYKKKKNDTNFTVGFIGAVRYVEQMKNLIKVAGPLGIRLFFAGYDGNPPVIEPLCENNPNIEWFGRYDYSKQIAELYGKCDAVYSVYDADMHNVRVALPNKLYEAVYCEMPLIVAKNTYLAQIVEEWGVGVAVDHKSVDELADALKELRENKALREQIAENCRKHKDEIDLQKYNAQLKDKIVQILGQAD